MDRRQRREPAASADVDGADVERFVGRYAPQPGVIISAVMLEGRLALQPPPGMGPVLPLTATSPTSFVTPALPGEVRFSIDEQGEPSLLIAAIGQVEPAPRLPALLPLSAEDFAAYVGRYVSAELDTWLQIRAGEGLEVRRRYQAWERIVPIAPDRFVGPNGELRFERDREGRVSGFALSAARVDGVAFRKEL